MVIFCKNGKKVQWNSINKKQNGLEQSEKLAMIHPLPTLNIKNGSSKKYKNKYFSLGKNIRNGMPSNNLICTVVGLSEISK